MKQVKPGNSSIYQGVSRGQVAVWLMAIYLVRMLRKGGLLAIRPKFSLALPAVLWSEWRTSSERSSTARAMWSDQECHHKSNGDL